MKNSYKIFTRFSIILLSATILLFGCTDKGVDKDWDVVLFEPGTIDASVSTASIAYGESVTFADLSTKVYMREWTFEGGDPATSSDSVVTVTYPTGGSYTATLKVTYVDNSSAEKEFVIEVAGPVISQWPYGDSPIAIPGVIEVENYDNGGEGFAYHDTEAENKAVTAGSATYRPDDGIDIQVSGDGSLINIGYANADEWVEYTIYVEAAAAYDFDFTLASGSTSGGSSVKIQLVNEDETVTDLGETGDFPNTGGWSNYTSLIVPGIELAAGEQTIRLFYTGGGVNLDKVEIKSESVVVAEKFGIYTEASVVGSVLVATEKNNAFTISTITDAYEGSEALAFMFDKVDTWGVMGAIRPTADPTANPVAFNTVDISEYAGGYYHVTLKTNCPFKMNLRLQGGGTNGFVQLDNAVKKYGFERNGTWQTLKIPIADFVTNSGAAPDLTAISHLLVLRSAESAAGAAEDWDWYVDNIYLTKE